MGMIKVFTYGVIGGIIGFLVGLPIGITIALLGAKYGIEKSWLYITSFLSIGGLIFFFLLPREQYFLWRKLKKRHDIKTGGLFDFAPASYFLMLGIAIGVRQGCVQFFSC